MNGYLYDEFQLRVSFVLVTSSHELVLFLWYVPSFIACPFLVKCSIGSGCKKEIGIENESEYQNKK